MNKCSVDISGMHCRSCEILIEDELKKIPGVDEAYVNHKNGTATIKFEGDLHETDVIKAVESAGYTYGKSDGKEKRLISFDANVYRELGIAGIISLGLFLLAKELGLFNLSAGVSGNYGSLPVVFLIGITAGISTCMALVGGLVLGSSAQFAKKHPEASGMEKFKPHLFFNLGRIVSYFILGGLIGFLGSVFQLSTSVLGIMTVGVGLVMLLLGTQLIDVFPVLKSVSFTIPKSVSRLLGIKNRADQDYTHKNSVVLGALTFFLPCGFTQAMQIFAMSTGSVVAGSLTMGVFALGTAPGLLGIGGLTAAIKGQASRIFFKTAGIVVIALSFFNITNGFNLLGVDLGSAAKASPSVVVDKNVKIVDGVQEVRMRQVSSGYIPNSFTIQKDLPVRWIINSEDVNTCAASIVSQKLGVRQGLKRGENIIEFTPTEVGTIRFSCSMGMFTGSFTVVDKDSPEAAVKPSAVLADNSSGGGGSCGASGGCGCGSAAANNSIGSENSPPQKAIVKGNTQVITTVYAKDTDISPNRFIVKANQPVRFEITAKDDGVGCMSSITIPRLSDKVELLNQGKTISFEFTPQQTGHYNITCGMGMPRGQLQVI